MASKRALRRKCARKLAYPNYATAVDALRRHPVGHRLHVYRCQICRLWHLGHRPARMTRAIAARLGVAP